MTLESAFWTQHLYEALRSILAASLAVAVVGLIASAYVALTVVQAPGVAALVAQLVATVIPLAISLDLVGWLLELGNDTSELREVERGLDRILDGQGVVEHDVLRLVAEYDSIVSGGPPIHPRLFTWKHDEIGDLWRRRRADPKT